MLSEEQKVKILEAKKQIDQLYVEVEGVETALLKELNIPKDDFAGSAYDRLFDLLYNTPMEWIPSESDKAYFFTKIAQAMEGGQNGNV
jgi:hypothetical protein